MNCLLALCLLSLVSSQTSCESTQIALTMVKKSTMYADEESFKILAGESELYSSPILTSGQLQTFTTCLAPTTNSQYTLRTIDGYGDAWSDGSWIELKGPNGNVVLKTMMVFRGSGSYQEEFPFSLYSPINKGDAWKYSATYADQWNTYSFADSAWTEVITASPGTSPVMGTQYFRKTYAGIPNMAAIELQVKYQAGLVAYINGVEIWRDNIAADAVVSQTTLATGSYQTLEYRGIIRSAGVAEATQSVLAIELHFMSAEYNQPINFDAFLAFLAGESATNKCFVVPNESTVTADAAIGVPENMINWGFQTYGTISTVDLPASAYFTIGGVSKPFISGVRLFSHSDVTYSPSALELTGGASASAETWTPILQASNIDYETYSFKQWYIYDSVSFPIYRVKFLSGVSTTTQIFEVQFLVCNYQVPTTFSYPEASYSLYATYSSLNILPDVSGMSNCTGTLPAGLTVNPDTCAITGIPTAAASQQTYTITGMIGTNTLTSTITITVETCATTMLEVKMVFTSSPSQQAFRLRNTVDDSMLLEVTLGNTYPSNSEQIFLLCLPTERYDITIEGNNNYWGMNSYLYIYSMLPNNEREMVLKTRFDTVAGSPATYYLRANAISPASQWHYKMGELPANWHSSSMDGFTQGSYGAYPESTNQIQLYKKTFTVSDINNVSGYVISIRYQYGCVIYLNGHEASRINMPAGDLTAATTADNMFQTLGYKTITLPGKTIAMGGQQSVTLLQSGTNTIAIALFALNAASQKTSYFDAIVRLMATEAESHIFEYTATASSDVYTMGEGPFSRQYSSYMDGYTCAANSYEITLANDRREWVTSVEVLNSQYTATDNVKQFKLYGRNKNTDTWTLLKDVAGLTWSTASQKRKIFFQNNVAYNQFKFENMGSGDSSNCNWRIQAAYLYAENVMAEAATLSYETPVTIFKDIEMAEVTPASTQGYVGFAINPALPAGIVIDAATGWISGTATAIQPATTYTITATKLAGGTATFTLSLEVAICSGTRGLVTARFWTDPFGEENSWKLYQGRGVTGTVLRSVAQFPVNGGYYYIDFCLDNGIYTFEGKDSYGDGWQVSSGYTLSVDLGAMELDMQELISLQGGQPTVTSTFSTYFPFQVEVTDWKYYQGSEIPATWNTASFDDAAWATAKAAAIPTTEYTTTLIRKTFTITNVADYQVLNVRVKYTGGVAAYFNGNLVARFNLVENFNINTESIAIHDANLFSKFHIILPTAGVQEGTNVMAFEIHRALGQSSAEPVVFDATGVFGVEDCSTVIDTYSELLTNGDAASMANLFDLDPHTTSYVNNNLNDYFEWTVENLMGSQWNAFSIFATMDVNNIGIALYGWFDPTNPDEERIDVDDLVGLSFKSREKSHTPIPVALAGFRKFRYEITVASSGNTYDSIVMAYCKASGAICPAIDAYPAVGEGQISPSTCPEGFKGYSYRECTGGQLSEVKTDTCHYKEPIDVSYGRSFNLVLNVPMTSGLPTYGNIVTEWRVDPLTPLPAGLTINAATGEISGTPTEIVKNKIHTIYASNPEKSAAVIVTISTRVGTCLAEGDFPETEVGKTAVYECANKGSYVGTMERACVLGAKDGEWQKTSGSCISVGTIVAIVIIVVIVIAVIVIILVMKGKKGKAKMAKAGKKGGKVATPKATTPKATTPKKNVKV